MSEQCDQHLNVITSICMKGFHKGRTSQVNPGHQASNVKMHYCCTYFLNCSPMGI
jgi:hypothetical protein